MITTTKKSSKSKGKGKIAKTIPTPSKMTKERLPNGEILVRTHPQEAVVPEAFGIQVPEFKDDEERADWLDANRGKLDKLWAYAGKRGLTGNSVVLKMISLRVPVQDLEDLQRIADKKGMRYQTYLKMLLHEAVVNAVKKELGERRRGWYPEMGE